MNALRYTGKTLFWVLTISVAIASWRFLVGGVAATMEIVAHNLESRAIPLYAHLIFGPLAMFLTPFQFWNGLRLKRPKLHRWIGKLTITSIVIASISAMFIALFTTAGMLALTGFFTLGVLWLVITLIAFNHIRNGNVRQHKRWMIRSAALTFAGVTLRIWLPVFFIFTRFEFEQFYPAVAWLCWVPNILIAEWWLRRSVADKA